MPLRSLKVTTEQIRAAFSLRQNLKHLFITPAGRFRPVDGLRALAVLWVILMHCLWFQFPFIPQRSFVQLLESAPRWIIGGPYGVDVFFVISGFLIGYILMKEYQQGGDINVRLFYMRRFLKLMPAYFAAIAIYCVVIKDNRDMVWSNILYINNFIPGAKQAMTWTWSLAIEEQFYFTFPCFLLLVFFRIKRGRLWFLGLIFALSLVIRAAVIHRHAIYAPIPWSLGVGDQRFLEWAELLYIKPHTRFGCLVAGVIAAYLYLFTNVAQFFERRRKTAAGLLLASFLGAGLVVMAPLHVSAERWRPITGFLALVSGRNVLGAATAYILLYSLFPAGVLGRLVNRFLSLRIWHIVAQLAYSAYLLHPMILLAAFGAVAAGGISRFPMIFYYLAGCGLTLVAAAVLYLFIERPFMNLRELLPSGPQRVLPEDSRIVYGLRPEAPVEQGCHFTDSSAGSEA